MAIDRKVPTFLIAASNAHAKEMAHQRWCHRHALHNEDARRDHDWETCPDCDRIGTERSAGLMAGNAVGRLVHGSPAYNKAKKQERKAERRRAARRAQRA